VTGQGTLETADAAAHVAHRRALAREALASGLYVALVLLAALIAVPTEQLPSDAHMAWIVLGTALGLLLAHWLAFRLAARITTEQGDWTPSAAQEAAAQFAGGLAVAVLAAAPFVVLEAASARVAALAALAALPALAGCLIARLRGRTWLFALTTGVLVLILATGVVAAKNILGH
jgi:hypothetical protein